MRTHDDDVEGLHLADPCQGCDGEPEPESVFHMSFAGWLATLFIAWTIVLAFMRAY